MLRLPGIRISIAHSPGRECIGALAILKAAPQDDGSGSGQSAFTIASNPSVNAAGPGCKIRADLISTMRSLRTAGISFQPGRFLILSGTTFLPHHDARITSGAAARTASGEMIRSFADC